MPVGSEYDALISKSTEVFFGIDSGGFTSNRILFDSPDFISSISILIVLSTLFA